jgi:hypothetical protein
MPVYDDQETKTAIPGSHDNLGVHPEHAEAEVADLEKQFANSPDEKDSKKYNDPASLKDQEESTPESPESRYGSSAIDNIHEKLGLGHTGEGSSKSERLSKMYKNKSPVRKRLAFAVALGGGWVGGTILFILMSTALRVPSIFHTLDSLYMSQANRAVSRSVMNMFSEYIRHSIIPALDTPNCKRIVDPGCVVVGRGTGPFGQIYQAWAKNRLELELATKHGLIIGKSANNKYYMTLDGKEVDISSLRNGDRTLWDLPGTKELSNTDIRRIVNDKLKAGTFWDKTYKRLVVNRYLKKQFGIRHCLSRCMWLDGASHGIDDLKASVSDKQLAYKLWAMQRLVPEKYQLIPLCLIDPVACSSALDKASPGEELRLSPAQKELRSIVQRASGSFAGSSLEKLSQAAKTAGDTNLKTLIAKETTQYLVEKIMGKGSGATAAAATEKAIPIVGWVLAAVAIVDGFNKFPDTLRHVTYAANTSTAAAQASMLSTMVAESESGNMDLEISGSFDKAFTADAIGSGEFASDASSTPLWGALMFGVSPAASYYGSGKHSYRCANGLPVPTGKLVCQDELPARKNEILDASRDAYRIFAPLGAPLSALINGIVAAINNTAGDALMNLCKINYQCAIGMQSVEQIVAPIGPKILEWGTSLINFVAGTPFRPDGGRSFNNISLGFDTIGNRVVRDTLGGVPGSPTQIGLIRSSYLAEDRASFLSRPLTARLFETTSQYSLLGQALLSLPSNSDTLVSHLAEGINVNPLSVFDKGASALLGPSRTYAINDVQQKIATSFEVPQYYVPEDAIPRQPMDYWNKNCAQKYDPQTGQLDISEWLNNTTVADDYTGEQRNTQPNPCMLLNASRISGGSMFDASMIPQDAAAPNTGPSTAAPQPASTGSSYSPNSSSRDIGDQIVATGDPRNPRRTAEIEARANDVSLCSMNSAALPPTATTSQSYDMGSSSKPCAGILASTRIRGRGRGSFEYIHTRNPRFDDSRAENISFLNKVVASVPPRLRRVDWPVQWAASITILKGYNNISVWV